jgi:hypothetical protein
MPRPEPFSPVSGTTEIGAEAWRRRDLDFAATIGRDRLCHYDAMAKTVIVRLTDDIDGGNADETVHFSLDGTSYEIDLSTANATRLREAIRPFVEKGRVSGGTRSRAARSSSADKTLYSQLQSDEKTRLRAWADMPTARRISDERVKSWVAAGRP